MFDSGEVSMVDTASTQTHAGEIAVQEHDRIFNRRVNPFTQTSSKRVLATLEANNITLYVDKKCIVKDISVKYFCIPNKISLLLYTENQANGLCDLPTALHPLIVEKATSYILEQVQSARYQTKQMESNDLN